MVEDFSPISKIATATYCFDVNPNVFPARNMQEAIALMRQHPGKYFFASPGNGTPHHIGMELIKLRLGLNATHVPYKGFAGAMQDLIGGQVPMFFSGMPPAMPHVRSGKLRALAVTTTRRSAATPDVPTMEEAGVPGFDISNWFAYFAPAGTPADVIAKLSAEINRSLKLQDVIEKLATVGAEPVGTSPEELGRFLRVESAKFANLIKASGAKGTD